jgi:uncharacterized protein YqhQ
MTELHEAAQPRPDGQPVAARPAPVGGQAILEGVMMRGVSTWAAAVRTPDGEIAIDSEPIVSWAKRHRVLRLPVVRGVVALAESLKNGFRALAFSAHAPIAEDEDALANLIEEAPKACHWTACGAFGQTDTLPARAFAMLRAQKDAA